MHNSIVGGKDHLIEHMVQSIDKARDIRIIVSFLMESGAKLLAASLRRAVERGVPVRILTGTYMSVTEPSAIYYLKHVVGDKAEIRFVDSNIRSFHPKAYLFDYEQDSEIYVGSSNVSFTALTTGIEWNYRLQKSKAPLDYERFSETFNSLFYHHAKPVTEEILKLYALSWHRSSFAEAEVFTLLPEDRPEPIGAQIEALYELSKAREEGVTKGLVVAATGTGKTYLSAFDSRDSDRVLFVAHREEILVQAEKTFSTVRENYNSGFYCGTRKDENRDVLFATVQTLGREANLQNFSPDSFDYIVIDEFHHAAADSYKKLLDHFRPRFLLGLTATPYRTDNRDILSLCDDNVIYEIYLKDAINRDLLVPFRYYGIFDSTDYSNINVRNGQYVIEELGRELSREKRAGLVLDKYKQLAGQRTLGFCVGISHASYMAEFFSRHKIKAAAVHSGGTASPYVMDRNEAVKKLAEGSLQVIFAVDIFNEGVDIPSLDTVMFLRPTESFTVFLQQLGRGLRKYEGKRHLTVLDFIGNYKRAHYIPALLSGDNPKFPLVQGRNITDVEYPLNCLVQFDFRVIDLFVEMAKADPLQKRMEDEYFRLKEELKGRPSRTDIYEGSDIPYKEYRKKGWLRFLESLDQLAAEEKNWLDTPAEGFLSELEKTFFTKSYKIPTISSFLTVEGLRDKVPLSEIGQNLLGFYLSTPLHQKDFTDKKNSDFKNWNSAQFVKLARENPVHFLSRGRYFHYDEVNKVFYLDDSLKIYLTPLFASHVKDILHYRKIDYFRKRYREEEQ